MVVNINSVSNPTVVRKKFKQYVGNDDAQLMLSEKKDKKYKVIHDIDHFQVCQIIAICLLSVIITCQFKEKKINLDISS